MLILGLRLAYSQRAFPGVYLGGLALGGRTESEIVELLTPAYPYDEQGTIILTDGEASWMLTPAELGVDVDLEAMALQATSVGRRGTFIQRIEEQIEAWYRGLALSPIVRFDQIVAGHTLSGIAAQTDLATIEASISIEGTRVVSTPGQVGRSLDVEATLLALEEPVHNLHDALIPLVIIETPPSVLDAAPLAAVAEELLRQPLHITADGVEDLVLQPATLAGMLKFALGGEDGAAGYLMQIDPAQMRALLEPRTPEFERKPENARFIFNDDTRELDLLTAAIIGRRLDIEASINAINAGLNTGQHSIGLDFVFETPPVGDQATAEELGISEAVSVVSTYFNGSSRERIQNIATASSAFHGLLIPPGETLSMGDVLGDISLDSGYAEALIIYGDKTIKGVGGGVCQVSTTLFRAVFFGGYEIIERHPHAYRVGYYEQGPGSPGPGLDATVFVPLVDFQFRNDTPYWLLMETYMYGNQLLWKFYSGSDGREVTWSSQQSNKVDAPKPLYKENGDLPEGKINQIDYEADGLDVVVYRTVTAGGNVLHEDVIKTHYLPWRAIYEFGPGTDLPSGVEVEEN
jgi:vancomycin resistance protein YoaR